VATFTIEEFRNDTTLGGFPTEPPSVVQAPITTSGTSQQSAAFAGDTKWIAISSEAAVRVALGTNPTASATTRYVTAGMSYLAVTGGTKIAVRDA
jgi:acyl dehydratase